MDAEELRQAHAMALAPVCGCLLFVVTACVVAAGLAMLLREIGRAHV